MSSNNIYLQQLHLVSNPNKYYRWYRSIIVAGKARASTRAEAKALLGYVEKHHIIPQSFNLGGGDDSDNLVFLTAKEHILCHELLCSFISDEYWNKCSKAFHCMCFKDNGGKNKRRPTLRQLAKARELSSIASRGILRGINGPPKWSKCQTIEEFTLLLTDHVSNNLSDPKIGKLYGVTAQAIFVWRGKLNINNRRPNIRNEEHLLDLYINKRMSASEIGKLLGCTGTAIQYKLIEFNIPMRSATERQKLKHIPIELRN